MTQFGQWVRLESVNEQLHCEKASLDIFWLRGESLETSDNLPDAGVLTQEIVEDLEAALEHSAGLWLT